MEPNLGETKKDWSALAIQKMLWDLHITPIMSAKDNDSISLFLSENDTTKFVKFLMEDGEIEFKSSQNELLIPLCLPDRVIKRFVELEETPEEKVIRHRSEHQKRLLYFLENLYDHKILTGLRTEILRKTVKLRKLDKSSITMDCFNRKEADFLKDGLSGYGFSVSTAQCDTCALVIDLDASSVSRTSQIVVEFCVQMKEYGLDEVFANTIKTYAGQRIPE